MTPEPSFSSGSFPARSQESNQKPYQPEDGVLPTKQLAIPSWSQGIQSMSHVASALSHNAVQNYLKVQMTQADNTNLNTDANSSLPESWVQTSRESDSYISGPEPNSDGDWFSGTPNFTPQHDLARDDISSELATVNS